MSQISDSSNDGIIRMLDKLRVGLQNESATAEDVKVFLGLLPAIFKPSEVSAPAVKLIRLIKILGEKWCTPFLDSAALENTNVVAVLLMKLFQLLPEPAYEITHAEIVQSITQLLLCLSIRNILAFRLFLDDCCVLLTGIRH